MAPQHVPIATKQEEPFIALLDTDENIAMRQSSSACSMKDLKNGVGSLHWIPQTALFTKASKLLDNALLRVILRLELTIPAPPVTMASGYPLSIQYQRLFNCEKYQDFTIITSDRKRIPVHKNILAIRSLVFEHMLEVKMEESHKTEVEIDDADYKTMLEFIRYIYYGEVHDIDSIATELLYIAYKYQVYDLQEPCVAAIAKKIKFSNVISTLKIADRVHEHELKKFCFEFIKWNFNDICRLNMLDEIEGSMRDELLKLFVNDYKPGTCVVRSNLHAVQ